MSYTISKFARFFETQCIYYLFDLRHLSYHCKHEQFNKCREHRIRGTVWLTLWLCLFMLDFGWILHKASIPVTAMLTTSRESSYDKTDKKEKTSVENTVQHSSLGPADTLAVDSCIMSSWTRVVFVFSVSGMLINCFTCLLYCMNGVHRSAGLQQYNLNFHIVLLSNFFVFFYVDKLYIHHENQLQINYLAFICWWNAKWHIYLWFLWLLLNIVMSAVLVFVSGH